jgi:hypothetical protein
MILETLIGQNTRSVVAFVTESIIQLAFRALIIHPIIQDQETRVVRTMRALGTIWVVTTMAVVAANQRNIFRLFFLGNIGLFQTDYKSVLALSFNRVKGWIRRLKFFVFVGRIAGQIGAFGMTTITEFVLLGDVCHKVANATPLKATIWGALLHQVRFVAIDTLRMTRGVNNIFRQCLTFAVNTFNGKHRVIIWLG